MIRDQALLRAVFQRQYVLMSDYDDVSQRIGNADREAAVGALQAHHSEGRLDSREYEERALQARQARTWAQLQPLFADLPEPRPVSGAATADPVGVGGEVVAGSAGPEGPISAADRAADRQGGLIPEPWAWMSVALTPFVALILFFVTGSWLWFLVIPIAGILVYGPDGDPHKRRDGHHGHHGH